MDEKHRTVKQLAIIVDSGCETDGKLWGKVCVYLKLLLLSDSPPRKPIWKRYRFEGNPSEYLVRDLQRLGFCADNLDQVLDAVYELPGIVVRVSLSNQDGASFVYLNDYFGRENPEKYCINEL